MAARGRRRSGLPIQSLLFLGGAVLLAGIGAFLLFSGGGEVAGGSRNEVPAGMVGVPVSTLDLPAYTEIQLEHLLDENGQLAAQYLPEDSILESTIVKPIELVGRVLAREKSALRVFREADFLPKGTRPGIVAGIPAGKRALRIDTSKVSGIIGLRQGDRFDLVATYQGNGQGASPQSIYGSSPGAGGRRARSALVADGATVVSALEDRALPGATPGTFGAIVQEMVIALGPDEIPVVTEALEIAKRIDCIPRSGLPGEGPSVDTNISATEPRRSPYEEPVVDLIEGDRRSLRFVPDPGLPAVGTGPARDGS